MAPQGSRASPGSDPTDTGERKSLAVRRSLRAKLVSTFVTVAVIPIAVFEAFNVLVFLERPLSQGEINVGRYFVFNLVGLVVAVVLSIFLARRLAGNVSDSMEGVVQRVRELSVNGETQAPELPDSAPRELFELFAEVDEMALGLHESYGQLQQAMAERENLHMTMQTALTELERRTRDRVTREVQDQLSDLQSAKDEAEAASRFKTALLASTSHEIRTPMSGIIGMAELLLKTRLDERQRQYTEAINQSADALLGVIDDLLDLAKIEAGKLNLESTNFKPRDLAQGVLDILSPRAKPKGLELQLNVGDGVPTWLYGDPVRFRQILLNLAGNAVKFTETGRVAVTMQREERQDVLREPYLYVEVRDTGVGISELDQPLLFEAFAQAETRARRAGTGLGLTISKQLVELMGGTIGLESQLGEGSTFYFRLPLTEGREPHESGSITANDIAASLDESSGVIKARERILVVEDNKINQLVIGQMLKSLGYPYDVAENGLKAIEALDEQHYDLVLMDCQMPELDGYEATRRIRAAENVTQHKTIIALTAHATRGERERCLAAGMDDYLAKPLRRHQLAATLVRWLAEAEERDEE